MNSQLVGRAHKVDAAKECQTGRLYDQQVLARLSPAAFTIQIASGTGPEKVSALVARLQSTYDMEETFFYYHSPRQSGRWYPVLYGLFETRAQADNAREALPRAVLSNSPYVRRLERIQDVMQESED